ncbi:polyadenylate-binding protein RBP47C-like [Brassica napus]|uniref:polyadenylate-binding protein RBP47C-like n=1 Tax=Brassica napus TaxID=3708 RepID=UPI0020788A08|nr:polyadenylate-binding protein RBP47C-like [Brassica napus]
MCNHVLIQMVSIKEIRNKHTGLSEGYGFVEFLSHDVADNVLKKFNGTYMPNTDMPFPLNWANAFDSLFYNTFSEIYLSVKAATAVIDAYTDRSKGFGFVRFGDLRKMNPELLSIPSSFVGGRPRPRRPFTDPFSFPVPSWGDVPEAVSEAVPMAPLRRLRSCFSTTVPVLRSERGTRLT